jgi:hypothetical protein
MAGAGASASGAVLARLVRARGLPHEVHSLDLICSVLRRHG